jgi:enediyne biosynthesis protein E4
MAKMTAVKERYRSLLRGESTDDPAELASLAESLGRTTEARGWAMIRDHKTQPRQPIAETSVPWRPDQPSPLKHKTMAVALADLRPTQGPLHAAITPPVCPRFLDEAQSTGLNSVQKNGQTPLKLLPETMSGGVGLPDYDGDGWLDVYAVQGGTLLPDAADRLGDRLFRNRRDGSFEDVTERAGPGRLAAAYGHGIAVGDYNNDGHCDLFVTRLHSYLLLHNLGDGTFEDMTSAAGLGGDRDWPTSAAWADLDGDGDLDLYVCHYLQFDITSPLLCPDSQAKVKDYYSPRSFRHCLTTSSVTTMAASWM